MTTTESMPHIGPTAREVGEFYTSLPAMPHESAAHLTGIWLKAQIEIAAQRANVPAWRKLLDESIEEAQRQKEGDDDHTPDSDGRR